MPPTLGFKGLDAGTRPWLRRKYWLFSLAMCMITDVLFQEPLYQRGESDAPRLGPFGVFHMTKFAWLLHEILRSQGNNIYSIFHSHGAWPIQLDILLEQPLVSH
ncbi:hypothetical protein BDR06DRAFT_63797 [Suillus hirtellus]|nr:hypothetical protein BDR06DRAFT_63797 [Suillus hirtellus]